MTMTIRRACANDESAIHALAKSEPVNPLDLHWFNFVLAMWDDEIVGAVQVRCHRDGSRELGTLIVALAYRGHGIAARLVDAVLDEQPGRVFVVTRRTRVRHYDRWGFHEIAARSAPAAVRRNFCMGAFGGRVMARLQRRAFRPLTILERPALPHRRREEFLAAQWF
jgi:N-acetylglutamate synthase-like GNAT family acetyltransferase